MSTIIDFIVYCVDRFEIRTNKKQYHQSLSCKCGEWCRIEFFLIFERYIVALRNNYKTPITQRNDETIITVLRTRIRTRNLLAKLCFFTLLNKKYSRLGKAVVTISKQKKMIHFVASEKKYISQRKGGNFAKIYCEITLTKRFHPRKGKTMTKQQLPIFAINYLFAVRNFVF